MQSIILVQLYIMYYALVLCFVLGSEIVRDVAITNFVICYLSVLVGGLSLPV